MNRFRSLTICVCAIAAIFASASYAQGFRRFRITQNEPPATELVVARWHFGTNGNIGHFGWSHNYPSSDQNFNEFIKSATGIDVELASYRIVELGSPEVFDYPFAYVSEPGEMELTDQELANVREFIDRGGFVLIDDFDGTWQFENLRSELLRAFPDRPLEPMSTEHPLFDVLFSLKNLDRMSPYVPGGHIQYYAMSNDSGALAVAAGHNNDLANFWEWYGEPGYPLGPAADAFRLGIDFVIWSMTH